jgi:tRNA U34 5-methylaminomethyl-2-thiouridine-forming methyltransferase MnmC
VVVHPLLPFEYKCVITGDGSPTLSLGPTWEHMHALEGAFTETLYIYQPTIEKAFNAVDSPVFLSLGLGIAYNELLIAFEALKQEKMPRQIASYESVAPLREAFTHWLLGQATDLATVYDQILGLYAEKYRRDGISAKFFLRKLFEKGTLQLLGAVEKETPPPSHALLFDAFSNKTSPELWTPEFLDLFFKQVSANPCFLSTYACNGDLKRALRNNGFKLDIQKGFAKKRHSTFASRII